MARFSPVRKDEMLCAVKTLQYVFVRNFVRKTMVKRIPLMHFPCCLDISADAKWLAVGTSDRLVELVSTTDQTAADYSGHGDSVSYVKFDADTSKIFSIS